MSTLTNSLPESFPLGSPDQVLTVNGSGFVATSKITWNGVVQPTTLVSPTVLTCPLTTANAKPAGRTIEVGVTDATKTDMLYIAHSTSSAADLIDYPSAAAPRGVYTYLYDPATSVVACVVGTVGKP